MFLSTCGRSRDLQFLLVFQRLSQRLTRTARTAAGRTTGETTTTMTVAPGGKRVTSERKSRQGVSARFAKRSGTGPQGYDSDSTRDSDNDRQAEYAMEAEKQEELEEKTLFASSFKATGV